MIPVAKNVSAGLIIHIMIVTKKDCNADGGTSEIQKIYGLVASLFLAHPSWWYERYDVFQYVRYV